MKKIKPIKLTIAKGTTRYRGRGLTSKEAVLFTKVNELIIHHNKKVDRQRKK